MKTDSLAFDRLVAVKNELRQIETLSAEQIKAVLLNLCSRVERLEDITKPSNDGAPIGGF